MKNILAFAGSNSSTSINQVLISGIASTYVEGEVTVIKLTDFEIPMYSEDLEKKYGIPQGVHQLIVHLEQLDVLLLSVNEHNSSISAFFKNCIDWLTRTDFKFTEDQKIFLTSTSNGQRGAVSALEFTKQILGRLKANIEVAFPFPSFSDNFDVNTKQVTDEALLSTVKKGIEQVLA